MYKDEFDDFEDDSSLFKMPASAMPGRGKTIFVSLVLGILIGAGVALFYGQYQMDMMENEKLSMNEMNSKLSPEDKVAKILRYNSEKKPVVAMVKDVSLIKDIPLYQFAQNGDSVIVYDDITVIYDEVNNKIVSAVPQNLLKEQADVEVTEDKEAEEDENTDENLDEEGAEEKEPEVDPIKAGDLKVEVRNGTTVAGLAGKRSKELTDAYKYSVTPANASKSTYKESILVDLSEGAATTHISDIRKKLDISKVVTELPEGEKSTTVDIVIIVSE